MSNQYSPPSGPPPGHGTSNPWQDEPSNNPYQQPGNNNPFHQSQAPQQQNQGFGNQIQQHEGYEAPRGPPPRRVETFDETSFIPADERGEQREALEHFEMNKGGQEDSTDRDVATLQREFPDLDGSLIAALYGDSKSLSGTREVLGELAGGN
ncbi:Hypothetical protein R9X50_00689600 [Acrodontium crateriforme]|uniref:CUE domain-containing protein n=1 Tax=Acrodontium crateriforme TaxID=150365 RepID=A0AAQ3MAM4_9PEZI|nr:Hypothetical protein R9X50_00689600 [Acrodontium crateriforme]